MTLKRGRGRTHNTKKEIINSVGNIFGGEMTIMDGLDSMNVSGACCIQIINEKDWGYGSFVGIFAY
jgi:hypothetical protein